jgi:hypothetical protein
MLMLKPSKAEAEQGWSRARTVMSRPVAPWRSISGDYPAGLNRVVISGLSLTCAVR